MALKVGLGLLISRGKAAEMLQFSNAAFDAIALFVQVLIVVPLLFAIGARRNHGLGLHGLLDMRNHLVRVVALVGDHRLGLALAQQFNGNCIVAHLAGAEAELQGQSQFIDQQVNFGRQSSSGTPQSLVRAPFLPPVAAC
jgi:hypothetical protein